METIKLRSSLWEAVISPSLGANILRLSYNGKDILNPLIDMKQLQEDPFIIGSPLLLPANRTLNGSFCFKSSSYQLPINEPSTNCHLHGKLHTADFIVEQISSSSVFLRYKNTGNCYPFKFDIKLGYSLSENGLCSRYIFTNTGNINMPFTFGLHTSFKEPPTFSVPISMAQERDINFIPTGKLLPLSAAEVSIKDGISPHGKYISGYYTASGHTACIGNDIIYKVSDNFDYWVLYNAKGEKGILCIEPQCGSVNGLNMDGGYKILRPSENIVFQTEILNSLGKTEN